MTSKERNDLLRELIHRYVYAKQNEKVWGREMGEHSSYCRGVLVGACIILDYEIIELKNCISLKSHNSGRIVLTEFIDEMGE